MNILAGLLPKVGEFAGNLIQGKSFGDALESTTKDIPLIGSVVKAGNKFFDAMDKKYPPRPGFDKWGFPVNKNSATIDPPKYRGKNAPIEPESDDDEESPDVDEDDYDLPNPLSTREPMRFRGADPIDMLKAKGNRLQQSDSKAVRENNRLRGLLRKAHRVLKKHADVGNIPQKDVPRFGRYV